MRRRRVLSAAGGALLPLSLSGCLESLDGGVIGDGPTSGERRSVSLTLRHVSGDRAISFEYDVQRATITGESPAVIELTAGNETDREIEYVTGAPKPFGTLYDSDSPEAILWTDRYAESQHVQTEGRRITGGEDIGVAVTLSPGGSRSETYEFSAPPGNYSIQRTGNPITIGDDTYELEVTVSEA